MYLFLKQTKDHYTIEDIDGVCHVFNRYGGGYLGTSKYKILKPVKVDIISILKTGEYVEIGVYTDKLERRYYTSLDSIIIRLKLSKLDGVICCLQRSGLVESGNGKRYTQSLIVCLEGESLSLINSVKDKLGLVELEV